MQFSLVLPYFLPLRFKCVHQHPLVEHYRPIFLPECERTVYTSTQNGAVRYLQPRKRQQIQEPWGSNLFLRGSRVCLQEQYYTLTIPPTSSYILASGQWNRFCFRAEAALRGHYFKSSAFNDVICSRSLSAALSALWDSRKSEWKNL
jgi:hypothetical protein